MRSFFAARGVLEVETPVLVPSPGVDRHIDAFAVGEGPEGYLATSPEYHMKRLLGAGAGPIFQLTRAFRHGERGPLHNPEFTILEWYRPGWDHRALIDEVEALLAGLAARHAPGCALGRTPYDRTTYGEAFRRHAGIDPHTAAGPELAAAARGAEDAPALSDDDRDGWLAYLQAARVEPRLGAERPTFVEDYPADQCALARIRPGDPPVAERFELYAAGLELANGFHELVDPVEQRRRILDENRARTARGAAPYPVDEAFLEGLAAMPAAAGVAVGVDRVLMLLLGGASVDEVIAFPGALDPHDPGA